MKLSAQDFESFSELPVEEMVDGFQNTTNAILCETFPEKIIIVSPEDKPWFNEKLRNLKRSRLREYNRHGRSEKYLKIAALFDEKAKIELSKYKDKIMSEVTDEKRGSSYPALKRLSMMPGESNQSVFHLPSHAELNYSSAQSAELIAEHFSHISQEYDPLDTGHKQTATKCSKLPGS